MTQPNAMPERHQPETLRLRTLTPGLTVSNLEQSIGWYCDIVGFVVVEKWEDRGEIAGAVIEAGRVRLFLERSENAQASAQTLRFYCATAQDIDALATAIRARGGTLASDPQDQAWGARTFEMVDPDGVRLTISSIEPDTA